MERVHITAVFIDDAEPVGISVRGKSDVTSSILHCLTERFQLRHHRLGMDAAEQRVWIAPDRLNRARCVAKKFFKDSTGATKPYTKPKRQKVVLSTSESFEAAGSGTFTRSNDGIKFFKSADKDDEIKFDGKDNVFKGSQLSGGVALYAEGAKPSAALDDVKLTLKLAGGSKTIGPDAVCKATSVEVTLDICKGRPSPAGDPPPLSQDDKIAVGRNLLVQDAAGHFERAQLIVRQVKPAAFSGSLVISAKGGVTAFTNEKPTQGEKAALPYTIADASKIPTKGDRTLWAEGKAPSVDMLDAGFILDLKGVEDDADHVVATAVQIQLDICQSRKKAGADPDAMSAENKVKVGRFVHEQDTGGHHGRALLVVRKVKPEKFNNYELGIKWDIHRDLSVTTAVYRLDRTNTRSTDPNDPTRIIQTGRTRSDGFEIGLNGRLTRAWRIVGGYAWQDAFIATATTSAPAGAQVAQVPHHNFSAWNNYQFSTKLAAGFGIVRRSDMFAAIDNTVTLPGYTRADAAFYYSVSEKMRLQANVENLFGTTYYVNADSNTNISPGSSRAVRVALRTRF